MIRNEAKTMEYFDLEEDPDEMHTPLSSNSMGSYMRMRMNNKSGVFTSILILLRAITSLGVMTNQFYFIMNGYFYSILIILLLMSAIGWSLTNYLQICNDIESKNVHFIERYEDIMLHLPIPPKLKNLLHGFTKVKITR